jgi:hypothetical protein
LDDHPIVLPDITGNEMAFSLQTRLSWLTTYEGVSSIW